MTEQQAANVEILHVYPINDAKEHDLNGDGCWCHPRVTDGVVVHNSLDRREAYEGKPLI
ncbi:MAG: hypothetical protein J3T61_00335 [Candidatus Brocadiales bacterium]|nr:hypothetical protein [Candidatus Bathyanammoxibius sp.]